MPRIFLRKSALADGEAQSMKEKLEAQRGLVEKLSSNLSKRKELRKSRAMNIKSLEERLKKGQHLAIDTPKMKAELKRLRPLLKEAEGWLLEAESEYNQAKVQLDDMQKEFEELYFELSYSQSLDIGKFGG